MSYVLDGSQGQEEVFNEAKSLVDSVVEGYNVCMLFFGPTGSGKTYTMSGRPGDLGMAANALAHLFRQALACPLYGLPHECCKFMFKVSCIAQLPCRAISNSHARSAPGCENALIHPLVPCIFSTALALLTQVLSRTMICMLCGNTQQQETWKAGLNIPLPGRCCKLQADLPG